MGAGAGQHGQLEQGLCWEEQLRVPLLIRVPGVAPRVIDATTATAATLDVWPTLFALAPALADESFARQCAGQDLLATGFAPRPIVALSSIESGFAAIVDGRHKLIRDARGRAELYDLADDPFELVDIAAANPGIVARLAAELDRELTAQKQREAAHHEK